MAALRYSLIGFMAIAIVGLSACNVFFQPISPEEPADQNAPDGIDPQKPNTERSTASVDFSGVRTIRIEIPVGRVSVSQSTSDGAASLKITEVIIKEGLSHDELETLLTESAITAERSFVDDARLDIEATVAEGLADSEIVFDVRLVVPAGANIEVLLANGPVEVSDLTGNVEIRTANGEVKIEQIDGNVVAYTTNRDVDVADVTGNVQVETSKGDITLRLVPGEDGVVKATTSGGLIRITVGQATMASMSLSAPDGIVTANLAGFEVSNLSTGSGFLSGTLNGGGGAIEATAESGEIEFVGME